jgi:hypothetical protein
MEAATTTTAATAAAAATQLGITSRVGKVIVAGYEILEDFKSASVVDPVAAEHEDKDVVLVTMREAFDAAMAKLDRTTLETMLWTDFKKRLNKVVAAEMQEAKQEQNAEPVYVEEK